MIRLLNELGPKSYYLLNTAKFWRKEAILPTSGAKKGYSYETFIFTGMTAKRILFITKSR